MQIYLPIAEMSVDVYLLFGMGGAVGFLAGMFGVGGGFLMTPILMFMGVPPAVAVASQSAEIVAASVSGVVAHWRRRNVDFKMGIVLVIGGAAGSTAGTFLFRVLREIGQIDVVIALCYVVFLGVIGLIMAVESGRTLLRRGPGRPTRRPARHHWMHGLPLKLRFHRSRLYISAIPPLVIGLIVGVLAAIMGVGGGFVMIPAMIYLLGMPTAVVVGTSLFQIIFVAANVTVLQAATNKTVDMVLALVLIAGAVIGAQIGTRVGARMRGEQLRGLLALMVLAVCARLGYSLVATPDDLYSLGEFFGK